MTPEEARDLARVLADELRKDPPAPKLALSVAEAAASIGAGRDFVYALINRGELRSVKSDGRRFVRVGDLEAWLEERARRGAA